MEKIKKMDINKMLKDLQNGNISLFKEDLKKLRKEELINLLLEVNLRGENLQDFLIKLQRYI